LKIYMDVCCLNRPFDDCNDDRISIESEAILKILYRCQYEAWQLIGSDTIDLEISKTTDVDKKMKVLSLYSVVSSKIIFDDEIESLAQSYQQYGIKLFDSIHLACAEYDHVDVLLTTDKKFIAKAQEIKSLNTRVENPVNWLMEVTSNELAD
jgi:predicted nucleic acid-binding protein